jgi:hypothetical protein
MVSKLEPVHSIVKYKKEVKLEHANNPRVV